MRYQKWFAGIICMAMLTLCIGSYTAQAGEFVIKAEIHPPDGTEIHASVPVSMFEVLKMSVSSAMVESKETVCQLVDGLIDDLKAMNAKDLLRVDGKVRANVWVEEIDEAHASDGHAIHVFVRPAGENQPEVEFRIPKGLVMLLVGIHNQFMEKHGEDIIKLIKQSIPKPPHFQPFPHHPVPRVQPDPTTPPHPSKKDGDKKLFDKPKPPKKDKPKREKDVEKSVEEIQKSAQEMQKMILEGILKGLKGLEH